MIESRKSCAHRASLPACVALLGLVCAPLQAAADEEALDAWLERQVQIQSWSAVVEQTRVLRALVKPLVATGQVVFAKPQRFRWQLGDPPRTLAVGTAEGLTVAYPRLRQAERYTYDDALDPAIRQVLDLLEVGFPSSAQDFRARYELSSAVLLDGGVWRFELQPRAEQARKLLEGVDIEVSAGDYALRATAFRFPDGSRMRNAFTEPLVDAPIDESLFELRIGDDWEVVEPLNR